MRENPDHLRRLEEWLRSYRPETLFDEAGQLVPEIRALAPDGPLRMSGSPYANGGLREPLPLCCKSSAAYGAALERGLDPEEAAGGEWTSTWGFDREDRDDAHRLVWGELALQELVRLPAPADEAAWEPGERSRFGVLARRLWTPLLAAEELEER